MSDSQIEVKRPGDTQQERSMHGLVRKLVANMAEGVGKGFTRVLEINGVGYRAEVRGTNIHFTLGYSHPIVYQLPPGVTAKVETPGDDHAGERGSPAAWYRSRRKCASSGRPSRIRARASSTRTEKIRRKAGKAAAGAAAG